MKKILLCLIVASSFLLADFSRSSGGVVTDSATNLQWQDNVDAAEKTWQEAINYCEDLTLEGKDDWRLPNLNELTSIVDDTVYNPSISSVFSHITSNFYLSSTTSASYTRAAWGVGFDYGYRVSQHKASHNYVRCVRAGQ